MSGDGFHSCGRAGARDGRCATCIPCVPQRRTHTVAGTKGGPVEIVRCGHCDGTDAHITVKAARA